MRRHHLLPISILAAFATTTSNATADQPLPQSWRKTMTSDPDVNYFLRKYSEPLSDPMATAARTIMLFRVLAKSCRDVKVNRAAADRYIEGTGFTTLPTGPARDAARLGAAQFDYFDYDALAHLCAGSDYLFGPRGISIKGAMSKGSGELAIPYDPKNLYLRVAPLDPRLE